MIRIKRKNKILIAPNVALFPTRTNKIGKRSATSTSKIMKIIASRKNRNEKGVRADPIGSNPHSYGVAALRSTAARLARSVIKKKSVTAIIVAMSTTFANTVIKQFTVKDRALKVQLSPTKKAKREDNIFMLISLVDHNASVAKWLVRLQTKLPI